MSTINPRVRQSAKVYRRRRLVLGLGVLTVIIIVALIVWRLGATDGESGATSAGSSSSDGAASADAAAPVQAVAAADGAPCDPAQLQVEAVTDAVNYEAGQQPQLSLSLSNIASNACLINAGTAAQVFTISSGSDIFWTSTDCQSDAADAEISLKPGVAVTTSDPIVWDRTRSAVDTCDAVTRDGAPADGASYNLTVSVDGIESAVSKRILLF
ncbi:MAG: hypothetical protein R6W83_00640 [Cryobacterium sp.]